MYRPFRILATAAALAVSVSAFAAGAAGAAQTVQHAAPEPAETVTIADVLPAPTLIGFQSKLSADAWNKIEAYVFKPAGASSLKKVPLVIVAHGHTGLFTCDSDADGALAQVGSCYVKLSTQYATLAQELLARGVGVMLVNSFTAARSAKIVSLHGGDTSWAVYPKGLGANRDAMVSDHASRPYDLFGAALAVPAQLTWADPAKLVALGYSHGGTAAMALTFSKHPLNLDNPAGGGKLFKRVFATYPGCLMGGANTNYVNSGAVVPLSIATGSADTDTPPGTMPGTASDGGGCRKRYDAAKTAVAANSSLYKIDWWNYQGATHSWETTYTAENFAARADWRARVGGYAQSLQ